MDGSRQQTNSRKNWRALIVLVSATFAALFTNAGEVLRFENGNLTVDQLVHQQVSVQTWAKAAGLIADAGTHTWIIQFKDKVNEDIKSALKDTGFQVLRYLPDDALVVRGDTTGLAMWQYSRLVQGIAAYRGGFKIAANLPSASVFSSQQKSYILVQAFLASDRAEILRTLRAFDPSLLVLDQGEKSLAIQGSLSLASAASQMETVEFVQKLEPFVSFHMDLQDANTANVTAAGDYTDLTGGETGTQLMGFESAWAAGFSGNGQVVGMADTGLDSGNTKAMLSDFNGAIKSGYAFGIGSKSWEDTNGHGTHVAGSVLSRGTQSGGKIKGGAHNALMVAEGMWSPIIDGLTIPSKMQTLFETAKKDGANTHTNSWGNPQNLGAYDAFAQAVDEFMWNNQDVLVLFAAGNSGVDKNADGKIDEKSVSSPGTAKNVMTVGASENLESKGGIQRQIKDLKTAKDSWPAEPIWSSKLSDNANGIAVFSSRGPTSDGRLKPEIVAPGTNILSTKSQVPGASSLWGDYNSYYAWSGGTSMATPLAAGAAAVAREILIKNKGVTDPSSSMVKAFMLHTAKDLYPGQYGTGAAQELNHRPDVNQGYGLVDLKAALGTDKSTQFVDSKTGVAQGAFDEIEVTPSTSLAVNLVWMDAPGSPTAKKQLVNDLDLKVISPSGKVFASQDQTNNNEVFELTNVEAGAYKIQVHGSKIPMGKNGKQPYALVVTAH